jgi:hypothetical protein
MMRMEVCEALHALVMRVDALRDDRVATPPGTITEATAIPCHGAARRARRRRAVDETLQASLLTCEGWRQHEEA